MRKATEFGKRYYDRYYRNPRTRVTTRREVRLLGAFVFAYLRYLGQPVRRVLDAGCGFGYWQEVVAERFPNASYTGIEISEYLCREYGWIPGSVVDYAARGTFDLVIFQDVMQYIEDKEVSSAIENLAKLCRGAVYLQFPCEEDWHGACDPKLSDGKIYLREASWYRRRIDKHFINMGGGLFIPVDCPLLVYELQKAGW